MSSVWKEYLYTHILFTVNTDNKCTTFLDWEICSLLWKNMSSFHLRRRNRSRHTAVFPGPKLRRSVKLFCDQMKWNLKYFFEKMDATSSELKRRGSLLLALSSKSLHLCWYGGPLVPIKLAIWTSEKALWMLKGAAVVRVYKFVSWAWMSCQAGASIYFFFTGSSIVLHTSLILSNTRTGCTILNLFQIFSDY